MRLAFFQMILGLVGFGFGVCLLATRHPMEGLLMSGAGVANFCLGWRRGDAIEHRENVIERPDNER